MSGANHGAAARISFALLTVFGAYLCPDAIAEDARTRPGFVVLDDITSRPIPGASVRLLDPFGYDDEVVSFSDASGRAGLLRGFSMMDVVNKLKRGNELKVLGWRVSVEADGYHPSTTPLVDHTGAFVDLGNPHVKQPIIRLRPLDRAALTESYSGRGAFFQISLILNGERFEATELCPALCSSHTPWFEVKHGTVTKDGKGLRLTVVGQEVLANADGEEERWLPEKLIRVRWDKRRYLIADDGMLAFCNAVNQGEEPRPHHYGEFLLGDGQEKIAVRGLPEVPEPWSSYLLKAPVEGAITKVLPDLRARVNIGQKQGLRPGMELVPTEEFLFSEQVVESVEQNEAVLKTRHPNGMYRKIQVGDVVSTKRPPRGAKAKQNP